MHGAALGAVDSFVERESDEPEASPNLMATRAILQASAQPISQLPFGEAIKRFGDRQVMPRALYDQLDAAAKQRAFTVAGLATEELLGTAHAELQRQLKDSSQNSFKGPDGKWVYKGPNLREFAKLAKERLESAGWTPANPSHVETIFRTNIQSAYSSGRVAEMSQPDVLKARPYWEIRAVGDSRTRKTHLKANGVILAADHPFWRQCFPPFGYNCRCKVISRSKRWVDAHGGPTHVPMGLPDPGFTSGTNTLLSTNLDYSQESLLPPRPVANPAHPLEGEAPSPALAPKPTPLQVAPEAPTLAPTPQAPDPVWKQLPLKPVPNTGMNAAQIMQQQIAGPGGSNEGGVYLGSDGVKRYVKLYKDPSQASGEHLANQIYADLGLGKVKSAVFDHHGNIAYASDLIEGAQTLGKKGITKELANQALDGLVGDMVTANWDAVGLSLDNMMVTKEGKIVRIDNGGTFLMRAKAGRKPTALLNKLTEWDNFFDPDINPAYSALARKAGITSADQMLPRIKQQLEDIENLVEKAGGWTAYVRKRAPLLNEADALAIADMLDARTDLVYDRIHAAEQAAAEAKKAAQLKAQQAAAAEEAAKKAQAEALATQAAADKAAAAAEADKKNLTKAELAKQKKNAAARAKRAAAKAGQEVPAKRRELAKLKAEPLPAKVIKMPKGYASAIRRRSADDVEIIATEYEKHAVGSFTGSDYRAIRAAARLTREEYEKAYHSLPYDTAKSRANLANSLLAKRDQLRGISENVSDEVVEVYRGVRGLPRQTFEKMLNEQIIQWDIPTSTSWNPYVAKGFYSSSSSDNYSIMYRIKPAPKTAGLSIEGISQHESENEILFGNGVKFRVVKATRDADYTNGAILYLEEIPQ